MKRIINVIKMDFITAKGGKKSMRFIILLLFLLCAFLIFFAAPIGALYAPFLMGGFIVPVLYQNEVRYHSDKMPLLLPIERKEIVQARFILSTSVHISINLIVYIMMLISLKVKIYTKIINNFDIMKMIAKVFGTTEFGISNVAFFTAFLMCSFLMSNSLRNYFKDNQVYSFALNPKTSVKKGEMAKLAVMFFVIILFIAIISGIIPLDSALRVILQLILQLICAANGFIFCAVSITISAFEIFYQYVSALAEYEKKDL